MLAAEQVHAEGPRYAAQLVLVPGLWAGAAVWRGMAGFLGHRGWETHLVDVRGLPGGLAGRAAAVAEYARALGTPAVLVGHDAGGLVAAAAASQARALAAVLVAPLAPGARATRALARSPAAVVAMLRGRPVAPPAPHAASVFVRDVPAPQRAALLAALAPDDATLVRELVWGRVVLAPAAVPTLLVRGGADPLLDASAAGTLADRLGAELTTVEDAGHWPLASPAWRRTADTVHRWLVQRLGAALLELYEEAMAERDATADDDDG